MQQTRGRGKSNPMVLPSADQRFGNRHGFLHFYRMGMHVAVKRTCISANFMAPKEEQVEQPFRLKKK